MCDFTMMVVFSLSLLLSLGLYVLGGVNPPKERVAVDKKGGLGEIGIVNSIDRSYLICASYVIVIIIIQNKCWQNNV